MKIVNDNKTKTSDTQTEIEKVCSFLKDRKLQRTYLRNETPKDSHPKISEYRIV